MTRRHAYAPVWPATVLLWGAGATAPLGLPTTDAQADCLRKLAAIGAGGLAERVRSAFPKASWQEQRDIGDFLLILGDEDGRNNNDVAEALRRQFDQIDAVDRKRHMEKLRLIYNWSTLRRVILSCPGEISSHWLQDLFNILDLHIQANIGFHASHPNRDAESAFIRPDALPTARRALQLLIILQFVLGYRRLLRHPDRLRPYRKFADSLARLMQKEGRLLATQGADTKTRKYYLFGYSLVSMNWDPLL